MTHPVLVSPQDAARDAASAASARSGVTVRTTDRLDDLAGIFALYREIWRPEPDSLSLSVSMLRALAKAGGYVAGAWDGDELVGMAVGFNSTPPHRHLHSHIAGVRPSAQGRGIGEAMKQHQRGWALEQGITGISWTFDPLVRRNAHFNIAKLGARPVEYLPDFYGAMGDAVNAGEASDRVVAEWDLAAPPADTAPLRTASVIVVDADGTPTARAIDADAVAIPVPTDIVALRRADPAQAALWRGAVRAAFLRELTLGSRAAGFDRERGYLFDRTVRHPRGDRP